MSKIIYLPLEHEDSRYTKSLDVSLTSYLEQSGKEFIKLYPIVENFPFQGSFLNAPKTIKFKSLQLSALASMFGDNSISDGDKVFCSDLWMPGIESLGYLNFFCNKKVRLTGILHAGSFTDTDFTRKFEVWAKGFEEAIFSQAERIFVGSNFIANDVCEKRYVDRSKLRVTGFPLDEELNRIEVSGAVKKDIVIFNGRNVDEKQPFMFDLLEEKLKGKNYKFINTQRLGLSKDKYYKLLAQSKCVVSFALQENFGFGVREAMVLGAIPVVPNRLAYPEFCGEDNLYNTFDQCCERVIDAVDNYTFKVPAFPDNGGIIQRFFDD